MLYREYGTTGLQVSAVGFGGMRFENKNGLDYNASLVNAAYEAGINYFDTAPGYDKSEEIFGLAFRQMRKTRASRPFYISTKSMKKEPDGVRKDIETSLERMGLDYIDFYHLGCVMSLDDYRQRKAKGVLDEFKKLKSEGLIKHIVISTHATGPEIAQILADYPFEGVLLGYSVMNFPYRDAGLDAAARLGRAVVVMNPLGGGLILQHPELFSFAKTNADQTVVQAALRFLLNDNRITIALVGLSTHEQLAEAIAAVAGFEPLDAAQVAGIRQGLSESFNQLCTSCRYCDNCPAGIPVPKLMDVYNVYVLSNDTKNTWQRMAWHWGIKSEDDPFGKCTECGACEDACTQHLPIRQRLKVLRGVIEQYESQKNKQVKNNNP